MGDTHQEWQETIQGLVNGDELVCAQFWDRYGARLSRVAQRNLPARLRQRVEPEDIVQSACRSFFRRVQQGRIELSDSEMLWPLLCAITLNKVRMQARFHGRQRRNPNREQRVGNDGTDSGIRGFEPISDGLSPDEIAMFAEQLEGVLSDLDDEECEVIQLKLTQHNNHEIADKLLCSERTVRRIVNRIRTRLQDRLIESTNQDG